MLARLLGGDLRAQPPERWRPAFAGGQLLTRNLREALALVGVKVLDHFVVAGDQAISFSERGLL